MKKRITILGLFLLMIFGIASVANAAILSSDYMNDWNANVYTYSSGTVDVQFYVQASSNMDKLGAKTIILQERATGSSTWNAVKTFSYTNDSGMLKNRTGRHDYTVSYDNAVSGYSYRAKVYFYAEKGGSDTIEFITSPAKAK